MKEDRLKALIEKGKLETSSDFTDQLMHKLTIQKKNETTVWSFKFVFGVTVFLIGGLSYFLIMTSNLPVHISTVSLKTVKMPILFVIFSFLLFALNHVIRISETYKNKGKDIAM